MRSRSRLALVLLLLPLWLGACSDDPTSSPYPLRPQANQQQVATPGFTFLGPLLTAGQGVGTFNAQLQPQVEICRLSGGACVETVAVLPFTNDYETGVEVQPDSQQYRTRYRFPIVSVNGQAAAGLPTGSYRISVLSSGAAGALTLGWIDLSYSAANGRATTPDGTVFAPYQYIVVKFFIADGTLCSTRASDNPGGEPCLETTVGPAGGTFTVDTKLAGVTFPAGALTETVTLVIERYEPPTGPGAPATEYGCLPVYHPQYEGCYVFRTIPEVAQFNAEVVVGVCPDPSALPLEAELELWKWDEVDPNTVQELPRRNVDFLECPGFNAAPRQLRRLGWGERLLRPLARLLGPQPLHARGVSPFGGGLGDFSRIGWVRPLALEIEGGNNQAGVVGSPLADSLAVRVVANGEKVAGQGIPIPGVTLTFAPSAGHGSASPATVVTNAQGRAKSAWTPGAAGANTLTVTGTNPLSGWPNLAGVWSAPPHAAAAVFSATAVVMPYRVSFSSPLTKGAGGVNVPGVALAVRACSQVTQQCWPGVNVGENSTQYHFRWSAERTYPDGQYRFEVLYNGNVAGSFLGAVAKTGGAAPAGTEFTFELGNAVQIRFQLISK